MDVNGDQSELWRPPTSTTAIVALMRTCRFRILLRLISIRVTGSDHRHRRCPSSPPSHQRQHHHLDMKTIDLSHRSPTSAPLIFIAFAVAQRDHHSQVNMSFLYVKATHLHHVVLCASSTPSRTNATETHFPSSLSLSLSLNLFDSFAFYSLSLSLPQS